MMDRFASIGTAAIPAILIALIGLGAPAAAEEAAPEQAQHIDPDSYGDPGEPAAPDPYDASSDGPSLRFYGTASFTARGESPGVYLNYFNRGDTNWDYLRTLLTLEAQASRQIAFIGDVLFANTSSEPLRIYGAYAYFHDFTSHDLAIQAGLLPLMIGTYGPRSYADKNPLIGTPLIYYYHLNLRYDALPRSAGDLFATRGSGQTGILYPSQPPGSRSWRGITFSYDSCWDFGAAAIGTEGRLEYRLGLLNGTPGTPSSGTDYNPDKSWFARLGYVPVLGLRMGMTASRGAYLKQALESQLPAGKEISDYTQTLLGYDLEISKGHWVMISEGMLSKYTTPYIEEDLDSRGGYVELQRKLAPGAHATLRVETLETGKIRDAAGGERSWDLPVRRIELGGGLWLHRDFLLKAALQLNDDDGGAFEPAENLGGLQAIVRF
jgi:hypothetical protein